MTMLGAQPVDLINNNPIKSFPFNVVDLPPGTQYIAWTLIDYDAVPVCGFHGFTGSWLT